MKGSYIRTPEIRAKLSASKKGKPAWNKGKTMPTGTGAKISKALTGKVRNRGDALTPAQRAHYDRMKGDNNPSKKTRRDC